MTPDLETLKNDHGYKLGKMYGAMQLLDLLEGKVSAVDLNQAWLDFKLANPLAEAPSALDTVPMPVRVGDSVQFIRHGASI